MRKGILRKIMACATGLVLVMGMSATVFATPSDNPQRSSTNTFVFEKDVKAINSASLDVAGPGATYSYAISSVTTPGPSNGGATITDGTGTAAVYAGPADGLAFSGGNTLSWPKTEAVHTAPAPGASNAKELTVAADITKFTEPGIYRYEIKETAPSTMPDGFTDANAGASRYVDVYIERGQNGLAISGIVMHNGQAQNGAPSAKKTFDAAQYVTKNVSVKKVVTGNMAPSDAHFAFTATVTDNDGRDFYGGEGATVAAATTANLASYDLANDEIFWIRGLSPNAKVEFTETPTFNGNTYTASNSQDQGGATMAAAVLADGTQVTFTNTLNNISPTGVVMMFGAPLALLFAAIGLIVMNRRSRKAGQSK